MIDERDPETHNLIATLQPKWTRMRLRKSHSLDIGESSFSCSSILFDDDPSLLCSVGSQDFPDTLCEYFPFRCGFMPDEILRNFEYVTLANKGGSGEFDRKLQWLFETPTLSLTEGVEEFSDSARPDAKHYKFSFYNGVLISDPNGRGSLRLTASDMPNFILTGELTFGPEAA